MKVYWTDYVKYPEEDYEHLVGEIEDCVTTFPQEFFDKAIEIAGEEKALRGYFIVEHPDKKSLRYRSKRLSAMQCAP